VMEHLKVREMVLNKAGETLGISLR
jgi:hypothetical protein